MKWHYSKAMPAKKLVKYGVYENDVYVGAVIYGLGANYNLATGLGVKANEACELVRIALNKTKHLLQESWPLQSDF